MGLFDLFKKPNSSAKIAKERLQIIVAHQRDGQTSSPSEEPAFMEAMKSEILEVVRKYVQIEPENIETKIERDGEMEILALSINLPDKPQSSSNETSSN